MNSVSESSLQVLRTYPSEEPRARDNLSKTKSHLFAFFKDDKSYLATPSTDWLRSQWNNGFLRQETIIKYYKIWRDTPVSITLKLPKSEDRITIQSIKRGTKRYNKILNARMDVKAWEYTWSHKSSHKLTNQHIKYKKIIRRILLTNQIFLTLTYSPKYYSNWWDALTKQNPKYLSIPECWNRIGQDFNRWWTGFKQKYQVAYYIKAIESHESGYPHIHVLIKLKQPLKAIKIGKYYRLLERNRIRASWTQRNGFLDAKAVSNPKKAIGYIAKYVSKHNLPTLNDKKSKLEQLKRIKTMALSWITRKHLISTSRIKHKRALYAQIYNCVRPEGRNFFKLIESNRLPLKKRELHQVESIQIGRHIITYPLEVESKEITRIYRAYQYLNYIQQRIALREASRYKRLVRFIQRLLPVSPRLLQRKKRK